MPVRRVSTLTQVLQETQSGSTKADQEPQGSNTAIPQKVNTASLQNDNAVLPQNDNIIKQQNDNTVTSQNDNTVKRQRTRKTDEREKATYYLDPGQKDKLEELRIAYKKATGKRLNDQDFMRMVVERLDLQMLLYPLD